MSSSVIVGETGVGGGATGARAHPVASALEASNAAAAKPLDLRELKGIQVVTVSSPYYCLAVRLEASVVCDEHEPLDLCLREQHAIEGVGVVTRKKFYCVGMLERNRQLDEAALVHAFGEGLWEPNASE